MIIKETKKHKYFLKVIADKEYEIENELVIKYNINTGKEFTTDKWNEILKENEYYYYDRIGKNKLSRLITKYELEVFLREKNASEDIIKKLITKYISYNFINDDYYTKQYISLKIYNKGPKNILFSLKEKGVNEEIINKHLNEVDEKYYIDLFITNYFKKDQKKNKTQTINYLIKHLINKGYDYSLVKEIIYDKIHLVKFNEDILIEKEFYKLFYKHKNKMEEKDLLYFIKSKLFQKGFNKETVNNFLESCEIFHI